MQEPIQPVGERQVFLSNPLLDFCIRGTEAQLKAWHAFQVEGANFVAKRIRANLEFLCSLGHCGDSQSISACQQAWLNGLHGDYIEELGRIAGPSVALAQSNLDPMASLFGRRTNKNSPETKLRAAA